MENDQLIIEFDRDKDDVMLLKALYGNKEIFDDPDFGPAKLKMNWRTYLNISLGILFSFWPLYKNVKNWPVTLIAFLGIALVYYSLRRRVRSFNKEMQLLREQGYIAADHVKVGIGEHHIYEYDGKLVDEISISEISEVRDDRYCVVITLKNEISFVFPKDKFSNYSHLVTRLQNICGLLGIQYQME